MGFWKWAEAEPDRLAVVDPEGREISFGELAARSNRVLHGLRSLGVQVGDSIAVLMPNGTAVLDFFLAASQGGLYLTTINFRLMPDEISYVLADSGAGVFVAHERVAAVARAAVERASVPLERRFAVGDVPGFRSLEDLTRGQPATRPEDRRPGDRMQYTSGTTGRPKGIRRPLDDADVDVVAARPLTGPVFGLKAGQGVHLVCGPMYHSAPLSVGAVALHHGIPLVLMDKWSPEETLRLIERYRVTTTHMVPTMFHRLLALPEETKSRYDLSSLETVVHGAAPVSRDVKRRMIEWWGPILYEYFGSTEVAGCGVSSKDWLEHPGTVGKPWPGIELEIVDSDGNPCPPGVPGRVYMSHVARLPFEYYKSPEKTAASRRGNFVTVGDIGYLDEEGWLYPCDREANMIISGGVNIYPAEVEAVLLEHPAVADVAVFGIPNEDWGEEVKAVVEPRAGHETSSDLERELIEFTRSRIAHYKCPRSVDFREHLPRDDNGKLYKRRIRDEYWEGRASRLV